MGRKPSKKLTWVVDRWVNIDLYQSKITEDAATGCWNYSHPLNNAGYGMVGFRREVQSTAATRNGQMMTAHRLAFLMDQGYLPPAPLGIHHRCHNRICVNPAHLKIGTHTQKMREMIADGRHMVRSGFISPWRGQPRPGPRKYSAEEIQWARFAELDEIQAHWNITRARASNLRSLFRYGYRWLPLDRPATWQGRRGRPRRTK